MKSFVSHLASILCLSFIFVLPIDLKATHGLGFELTYECTGSPNEYNFKLKFFRDCHGIAAPGSVTVYLNSATCGNQSVSLSKVLPVIDLTPLCAGQVSNCTPSHPPTAIDGVEQHTYEGTITLNCQASDWIASYSLCCRNSSITTGAASQTAYITASLDNTVSPCNSSPQFSTPASFYACKDLPVTYNHGVSDADGDELRFYLAACKRNATNNVTYDPPFSFTNPLTTASGVSVNEFTGNIEFTPTALEVAVVCVRVEEYRGGMKIGEVYRDIQFNIRDCSDPANAALNGGFTNTPPSLSAPFNYSVQEGNLLTFAITPSDLESDIVEMGVSNLPSGASLSPALNTTPASTVTPSSSFSWTPTAGDVGSHTFFITTGDDGCDVVTNTYTYTIEVTCGNISIDDIDVVQPCTPGTGSITITASTTHPTNTLEYSIDGGLMFQLSNTFLSQNAGSYDIVVQEVEDPTCSSSIEDFELTASGAPLVICPPNITIQLNENGEAIPDTVSGLVSSVSDCDNLVDTLYSPSAFSCSDAGTTITLTISVVDDESPAKTGECTVQATIVGPDPVAVCKAVTVELDANGEGTLLTSQVDDGSTDVCGTIQSYDVDPNTFDCEDIGTHTVTLTVTDNDGNTDACTTTVTVEDNEEPVAICQDITVQLDANGNTNIQSSDLDGGSSDNCAIDFMTATLNSFDCDDIGTHTVTLTVTDESGNTDACTAKVTVQDNEDPVANCQNITVQLDANGEVSILPSEIDNSSSDNTTCVTLDITPNSFDCSQLGTNLVTLTITDGSGNTDDCMATVTVEDNIDPVITCPADISVDNDPGECSAEVSLEATAVDNCITAPDISYSTNPVVPITNVGVFVDVFASDAALGLGVPQDIIFGPDGNLYVTIEGPQRRIIYYDPGGAFLGDFVDPNDLGLNTALEIAFGSDGNLYAPNSNNSFSGSIREFDGTTGALLTTVPASGFALYGMEFGPDGALYIAYNGGVIRFDLATNTFSTFITDAAISFPFGLTFGPDGNIYICTLSGFVRRYDGTTGAFIDNFLTGVGFGREILFGPDGNFYLAVSNLVRRYNGTTGAFIDVIASDPSISQASGITFGPDGLLYVSNQVNGGQSSILRFEVRTSGLFPVGTTSVTATATDASGNTASCDFDVIVSDNEDPVADCQDITVQIDVNGYATIQPSDLDENSSDNCDIDFMTASSNTFDCDDIGTHTVTMTVTDESGKTDACTATVTVADDNSYCCAPPVAVCDDFTLDISPGGVNSITADDVNLASTAECGLQSMSVDPSTFDCSHIGTNTVVLTVTDINNESSTCTATVTVVNSGGIAYNWTGALSSDWTVAGNWDLGCVPGALDDVYIPNAVPNDPHLMSGSASISNLTLETGASLLVDGTLTMDVSTGNAVDNDGDITVNGTLYFGGGDFVNNGMLNGTGSVLETP
jgi:streptogramin lyase